MMLLLLLILGAALAQPTTAPATPPTTPPATRPAGSSLDERLVQIDARTGEIRDLTAGFVQEKRSPLLRDPLVTRGTLRARPAAMLWDARGATPTRMSVDADRLRILYVEQNVVEEYPVQGNVAAMTASPLPRLAALRKSFAIEADDGAGLDPPAGVETLALRLTPTADELLDHVDAVRVLLDAGRGVVLVFEVTDPDGEVTTMRFGDIETNVGLVDADLRLDAPANAKVVRPLGGGAGR